ncbi:hypothetical protein J2T08_006256 [Neorhizobium galegae]|uniref:nuclear transport factor 2 family protein n=1 Tax=Neorhizobium galegae TaxID=399 RepID=UPI0027831AE7|nr:hypothetical protein [Neorhizobium galegae]MDQ0138311.1 hypothetical protein [Neorhizobium galegae]
MSDPAPTRWLLVELHHPLSTRRLPMPECRAAGMINHHQSLFYYEPGLIVAEGDFVAIHGRIRGWADEPQVVIDVFRVEGGKLAEHWVLQNEVPVTAALGGVSMFDPEEGALRAQPGTA